MNDAIQKSMLTYFEERAEEYDDFYAGKGPAIQHYGGMYIKDLAQIGKVVSTFGGKHLIDIGCGTAHWTSFYASKCEEITCIDQSANMLTQAREKIKDRDLKPPKFIHGNFFDIDLGTAVYDCALVSILLSHLSRSQEKAFFERLKQILLPGGPAADHRQPVECASQQVSQKRECRRAHPQGRWQVQSVQALHGPG